MLILNKPVRSMNNYNYDDEMREEQLRLVEDLIDACVDYFRGASGKD